MSTTQNPREDYLARLEDLLPASEISRVREDVESLILERASGEADRDPALSYEEAERRAIAALGSPEKLAEELVSSPLSISMAARRMFARLFAGVFACHLLLSIALTVADSTEAPIPGLLSALPKDSIGAMLLGVVSIFLLDAGALLVLFVALGKARPEGRLPSVLRGARFTRRGAFEGLVLLGLLAVMVNVYAEQIFSVKQGDQLQTFLAPELLVLLPYVNIVLLLFAMRHALTLLGKAGSALSFGIDALAALSGCVLLLAAITRSHLVQMPTGPKVSAEAGEVLDKLTESVFLVVFVIGALLLILRFVRHSIACWRSLRS